MNKQKNKDTNSDLISEFKYWSRAWQNPISCRPNSAKTTCYRLFMTIFALWWQSWAVVTKSIWPVKQKIFTICTLVEKVWDFCSSINHCATFFQFKILRVPISCQKYEVNGPSLNTGRQGSSWDSLRYTFLFRNFNLTKNAMVL